MVVMAPQIDFSNVAVAIIEFDSHGHQSPLAISADIDLLRHVAKQMAEAQADFEGEPTARGAMATVRLRLLRQLAGAPEPAEGEAIAKPGWWDAITTDKEDQSAQS
jgi:hypothetical protein